MHTPILCRLATLAAHDAMRGDRSTFTHATRTLRGPVLRRFAACYYTVLTGVRHAG